MSSKRKASSFLKLRKWVATLHLWLGLPSALIVFLVSISGCILVFEQEIKNIIYKDKIFFERTSPENLSLDSLWENAVEVLGPDRPVSGLEIYDDPNRTLIFNSFVHGDHSITFAGEQKSYVKVYINPQTGEVVDLEDTRFEFFNMVFMLHWSLLFSEEIGQPIVGWGVIAFVVLLLSGMLLWWPRNKAALKMRLKFAWKAPWIKLNWDLHAVAGFYSFIFALLVALTGLTWAFDWFDEAVHVVTSIGEEQINVERKINKGLPIEKNKIKEAVLSQISDSIPEWNLVYFKVKEPGTHHTYIYTPGWGYYDRSYMAFDDQTAQLKEIWKWEDKTRSQKLESMFYDIHVGSILGLPGQILAFLVSLVCASLPISGLLMWWNKRKRKKTRYKSTNV